MIRVALRRLVVWRLLQLSEALERAQTEHEWTRYCELSRAFERWSELGARLRG